MSHWQQLHIVPFVIVAIAIASLIVGLTQMRGDRYDEQGVGWLHAECEIQSVTSFEGQCVGVVNGYAGDKVKSFNYFGVNMHVLMSSNDTRLTNATFRKPGIANKFPGFTTDCGQTGDPTEDCENESINECFGHGAEARGFVKNYKISLKYPCYFDPANHSNIAFVTFKNENTRWAMGRGALIGGGVVLCLVIVAVVLSAVCCPHASGLKFNFKSVCKTLCTSAPPKPHWSNNDGKGWGAIQVSSI
eukprot:m.66920 g.66920  ORF g.66920 m.66920 type:complete len:246 (-) comp23742_c0_seq1:67-804(-)